MYLQYKLIAILLELSCHKAAIWKWGRAAKSEGKAGCSCNNNA